MPPRRAPQSGAEPIGEATHQGRPPSGGDGAAAPLAARSASWLGRIVVYGLVGALAVAAVFNAEWWPISSMRLFSHVRGDSAVTYEVHLVGADGADEVLDVASLGRSFRGAHHVVPRLADMPADERDAVCQAWARAAADDGGVAAVEVRVDRVVRSVPMSSEDDVVERSRREVLRCAGV